MMNYKIPLENESYIVIKNVNFEIGGGKNTPDIELHIDKKKFCIGIYFTLENEEAKIEFYHKTKPIGFEIDEFDPNKTENRVIEYLAQFISE